ncbi:MAG: hypothetical protein Q9202_001500 [Teloschistes flavicans]
MSSPPSTYLPLALIVRFALPVPDLPLTVLSPASTTPLHLLHHNIRPHLPPTYSSSPIRLISSGALLPPSVPLSKSLRLPSAPPSSKPDVKGKGKERETSPTSRSPQLQADNPIYIHCSISTAQVLSSAALALEAEAATANPAPPQSSPISPQQGHDQWLQRQEPQGFDCLLSAGLTPSEISALRSQFLAQTAHTHTPDTMPSPQQMRRLEERWLDSSGPTSRLSTGADDDGTNGVGVVDDDDDGGGALSDMLWGNLMGFFWPVGAAIWLCREEGVWSKRRQVAVITGVLVNLSFGLMRMGGG